MLDARVINMGTQYHIQQQSHIILFYIETCIQNFFYSRTTSQ